MITTAIDNAPFDFFHTRLNLLEVTNDDLLNIGLWHCLSEFEDYAFGVVLQYDRIRSELANPNTGEIPAVPGPQPKLDVYYYVLTWEKLKKVYDKIKEMVNRLQQANPSMPRAFFQEFRTWKTRIEHLFAVFDTDVRNEYEHPSLEPYTVGNIIMWGTMQIDRCGDINVHVGKNWFANIKAEHSARIQALRTALFDLFLKHFSQKPLIEELVKMRTHLEENIDSILDELETLKAKKDATVFNNLLHRVLMHDLYLQREGVPLSATARGKFYSVLTGTGT